ISNATFTLVSLSAYAESISGGEQGYDKNLQAIEPQSERINIGLAGEQPANIARYILAGNQGVSSAAISPDGKSVAFVWSITGKRQLWIVSTQGGQPQQLTFGNGVTFFRWSPNGEALVYGADNDGNGREAYYSVSRDGRTEKLLVKATEGGYRVFGDFVNNHSIVYASTERNRLDFDLYTADINTGNSKQIYQGKYGIYAREVSPSGRYLVVSEVVGEDSDNLFLFDLEKDKLKTISKPKRRANHTKGNIVWREDSQGFYLSSNLDRDFSALMYFDVDKGFQLVHEEQGDIENVGLCGKNKEYLYWSLNDGGYSRLRVKSLERNKMLSIPELPQGVYGLSCGEATMAITISGSKTPTSVYSWNIASNQVLPTFVASLAGLDPESLIEPESIRIPARDGVLLQGLLYLPKNSAENKPPVVFNVHGGPTGQARPRFSASTQYLLAQGIAVFAPNVRGSTGFGHKYVTLDDRENRLESIADLVDMLKHLEKDGRVDAKNAAVVGGSYGGYAVNAVLANYPGHFKAGISIFGVSDWVTALQIASPSLKASDRIEYGDISEKKWLDFYTKYSPIRQADKINVPVLYAHGVNDPQVDVMETEVMVKTLRKNGLKAPYIRFLDEGHGWRKLKNKLFYHRRSTEFLKQQLGLK
ncbi:MAG: S9 family peptidase, partial [Kangiellaceae bacterium]|nr:S9 family peptidase [Kangiellaceae bacterium]